MMMLLGTAKVDITPSRSVPLAGFSSRAALGAFSSVAHPLHARICCFQDSDAKLAVLVSADLLWWGDRISDNLRQQIRRRWPAAETIILHGTHSHSGPQTADNLSSYLGLPDSEYMADLEQKMLSGIEEAIGSLEQVTAERGEGECGIAINRRHFRNGDVQLEPNTTGPVDCELTVIRYRVPDGRVKAVFVHYACHPVVNSENVASSEFTGFAMDLLEESIGDGAVCAFLQGTCGDINPVAGELGGNARVVELGRQLAKDVTSVMEGIMHPLSPASLRFRTERVDLPLQRLPDREYLETLQSDSNALGEWSRHLLRLPNGIPSSLPLEVTAVTLQEGLALLAMNAEVVVEYGQFLKSISGKRILPLGYSNGMIGYVTTARQLDEGGYEPVDSTVYFSMPAPFSHEAEPLVREMFQRMTRYIESTEVEESL